MTLVERVIEFNPDNPNWHTLDIFRGISIANFLHSEGAGNKGLTFLVFDMLRFIIVYEKARDEVKTRDAEQYMTEVRKLTLEKFVGE
jgi:hypothetical protein